MSAEFPPNSHSSRQPPREPKKVERIISGEATRRKKSVGRQFKETFFSGEDSRSIAQNVVLTVIIPAIQDLVYQVFQTTLERKIYGDRRPHRGMPSSYYPNPLSNSGLGARVDYPYNRISQPTQASSMGTRMLSREARSRNDFDDIIIPTRPEAEDVLARMYDILSQYNEVPVADLFLMTGIQVSHTDYKFGWRSLQGARIERLGSGQYLLNLPKPIELER